LTGSYRLGGYLPKDDAPQAVRDHINSTYVMESSIRDKRAAAKEAAGAEFCAECGGPIAFDLDSPGVSHHVTEWGEIDYDLDADHTAYGEGENFLDGPRRTNAAPMEAASSRTLQARAKHEAKLNLDRRTKVADESDSLLAEVLQPFERIKTEEPVKGGDGRPEYSKGEAETHAGDPKPGTEKVAVHVPGTCKECRAPLGSGEALSCKECGHKFDTPNCLKGHRCTGKTAGGHKPGCGCGFCKNKGSFGKNNDEDKDEKETKEASGELVPSMPHDMEPAVDLNDGAKPTVEAPIDLEKQAKSVPCPSCGGTRTGGRDGNKYYCADCRKGFAPKQAARQPIKCDQCQMSMINGVPCHEHGCPNSGAQWNPETQSWDKTYECRECGDDVPEGETCNCQQPFEDEAEQARFGNLERTAALWLGEEPADEGIGGRPD
jgi:hypothetical protein